MIRMPTWPAGDESVDRIAWQSFSFYPRLGHVGRYVAEHLGEQITLRDAARVACLEHNYFSAFFHKKVGITFSEWLRVVRVMRSTQLLRAHDLTVSRAAYEVGFGSVRAFERSFRRIIGMTPAQFKWHVQPENGTITKSDASLRNNVAMSMIPRVS